MNDQNIKILALIADYLDKYPGQRFGQVLFNLDIIEFADKTDPSRNLRDIYNDSNKEIIDRIKSTISKIEDDSTS